MFHPDRILPVLALLLLQFSCGDTVSIKGADIEPFGGVCGQKECGPNGAGGTCGTCPVGEACVGGTCLDPNQMGSDLTDSKGPLD